MPSLWSAGHRGKVTRAAIPFFACLVVCIGIITVFPDVVTWLPDAVMGVSK
jgi:TRAP-type C4-dicarboxylate transport system permease large subunit